MKKMYDILIKFQPTNEIAGKKDLSKDNLSIGSLNSSNSMRWDETKCGLGIQFEYKCELVMLKEQAYVFRTAIGSTGFTSGLHYWEIIPDLRT